MSGRLDTARRRGHTLLGICSLVIAVLMGVALIVLIVVLGVTNASTSGGIDESSLPVELLGLAVILCLFGNLVGLALGIAGMIQRRERVVFAVVGGTLNGSILLTVTALIIFGLAIGG